MKKLESILAEKLLKISAIKLQPDNPFTWSSGWNSPIYTDNRKFLESGNEPIDYREFS